jgi:prevent-host-death family protein
MLEIGSFEAKTKLPELLRMVESKGQEIIITRNGKKIAKLSPINEKKDTLAVLSAIKTIRKRINLDGVSIKDLIEEGRK